MLNSLLILACIFEGSSPEWKRTIERHQQSLQQLSSYQFEYIVKGRFGSQKYDQKGMYIYSNGRIHFKTRDASTGEVSNVFVADGRCITLEEFKNGPTSVVIARSTGNISFQNQLSFNLCFSFANHIHEWKDKPDLSVYAADMEQHFVSYEPDRVGGLECMRLTFRRQSKIPGRVDRIWLTPQKNWLVVKSGSYDETDSQKFMGISYCEVLEWAEPRKGIFFPKKVVHRTTGPVFVNGPSPARDVFTTDFTTTLSQIRIDPPLKIDYFNPTFAIGSTVLDEIEQCTYTVGPNNQKLKYESRLMQTPFSDSEKKNVSTNTVRPPTVDEPTPWSRWLLPTSIVLLIGAAIFKWRHSRANRDDS